MQRDRVKALIAKSIFRNINRNSPRRTAMSKTGRYNYRRPAKGRNQPGRDRHVTVRSERKDSPDLQKLGRAIIAMELEEMERQKATDDAQTDAATGSPAADLLAEEDDSEAAHDNK
ncbi:hypothetical protein [Nocardia mangyaensis]|uniref:hypothetical protein n=1 Tax=Nocardia mangyaensis TaxID=2213200 RepID=UPI00197EE10F|nr:hypothetical protein [Nocardia mangyaensis]